ncbi:MAG: DNA-3-methyladenine glycosylase, partial [Vulcanococcus sp.]
MPGSAALAIPQRFFARPAEVVAPELVGCLLVKRQPKGELLWGVIVETEAYSQDDPAFHGYRRRSPSNETFFGEPGRFYVYVSYGIHHCVNVVTHKGEWANGVLLRALALPAQLERLAADPAMLRATSVMPLPARCRALAQAHGHNTAGQSGVCRHRKPPASASPPTRLNATVRLEPGAAHEKAPSSSRGKCRPSKGGKWPDRVDQPNLPEVEAIR